MLPRLNKAWFWQMFPLINVKALRPICLESASNLILWILNIAGEAWVVVVRIPYTACFKCKMAKGTLVKGSFSH